MWETGSARCEHGEQRSALPAGDTGYGTTEMPRDANGYRWINVQFDGGVRGRVATSFVTWI